MSFPQPPHLGLNAFNPSYGPPQSFEPDSGNSNPLTISDDRSNMAEIQRRKLLALNQDNTNTFGRVDVGHQGNKAIPDHQMQLMLLEQQNKRRLLMARAEQDSIHGISPPRESAEQVYRRPGYREFHDVDPGMAQEQDSSIQEKLQEQILVLESRLREYESAQSNSAPSRHQVLHRLKDEDDMDDSDASPFMDPPEVVRGQMTKARLRCSVPLHNFELYLAMNPDISFVVFRDYSRTVDAPGSDGVYHPRPLAESIRPVAADLKEALTVLLQSKPEYGDMLRHYSQIRELSAPYLFIYHSRQEMDQIKDSLSTAAREQLDLLLDYVSDVLGAEYDRADSLFERNEIRNEYIQYLFKPGDILVARADGQYTGYISKSWPYLYSEKRRLLQNIKHKDSPDQHTSNAVNSWSISGLTWGFDGSFHKIHEGLVFEIALDDNLPNSDEAESSGQLRGKPITDLKVFPLKYAPGNLVDTLRRRGETIWKCRTRNLVSYKADAREQLDNSMVCSFLIYSRS